jgi:serine acetyltransferase
VVILPGSRIGDRVVVAPGSVVSGTIADDEHISGNPALSRSDSLLTARGIEMTVADVVAKVFDLATPPHLDDHPDSIAGWDSLGAL